MQNELAGPIDDVDAANGGVVEGDGLGGADGQAGRRTRYRRTKVQIASVVHDGAARSEVDSAAGQVARGVGVRCLHGIHLHRAADADEAARGEIDDVGYGGCRGECRYGSFAGRIVVPEGVRAPSAGAGAETGSDVVCVKIVFGAGGGGYGEKQTASDAEEGAECGFKFHLNGMSCYLLPAPAGGKADWDVSNLGFLRTCPIGTNNFPACSCYSMGIKDSP